jgi:hemoglobin
MKNGLRCVALGFVLLSFFGCSQAPTLSLTPDNRTLFERIGGLPVLKVVVSEGITDLTSNPKTKRSFEGIKLSKLEESIVSHLCHLTGGGCIYEGETMKNSHADAKITAAEFEVFVQIFRDALDRHVGTREKNELLKILAPMRRDIVTANTSSISTAQPAKTDAVVDAPAPK